MNQLQKIAIAFVMAALSFGALAQNASKGVYPNDAIGMKQCLDDAKNGKAVGYVPTTKNPLTDKSFGVKKVGKGGACLSGAYVREDKDAKVSRGVVYVAEGFAYGEQKTASSTSYRMVACSNPFDGINVPPEQVATPTVVPGSTTLVVNKIIERNEITIETTIAHVEVCKDSTARPKSNPATGKLECPPVEVHLPITVIPDVKVAPQVAMMQPKVTAQPSAQATATCATADCGPAVKFDRKVARTDGRCVVAFKDPAGVVHYARFDTANGNKLVAARVDNEKAEWNRSYTPTYVGYLNGGEKKTVEMSGQPDCDAVYRAISHPKVLAWTGPRLGLTPDCLPVGKL